MHPTFKRLMKNTLARALIPGRVDTPRLDVVFPFYMQGHFFWAS
jgi:hypothetical protein